MSRAPSLHTLIVLDRLSRLKRTGAGLLVGLACLWVSSCAAPFGPRFVVERQQIAVRYPVESEIEISASFYLRNIGNGPLSSIDLDLPDTRKYALRHLEARIDGRTVTATASDSNKIRLPMDPAVPIKQGRELSFSYGLATPTEPSPPFLAPDAFFLERGGWYPALIQPKAPFPLTPRHAYKRRLTIQVPSGFLAYAPGRSMGTQKRNAEVLYRFELTWRDFEPFVVAGRYQEQRVRTIDRPIIFWTRQPADQLQTVAERIAAAVKTYRDELGRGAPKSSPVWIVECAAEGPQAVDPSSDEESLPSIACPGLPNVAQIPSSLFRKGIAQESFLKEAEYKLAYGWFSRRSALAPGGELLPMNALPDYAALLAEVAQAGEPVRQRHAARLLERYDRASRQGPEKKVASIGPADPAWQQVSGYARSEMFFLALEDAYGREPLYRALARLTRALPSQRWTAHDLLAALELEGAKNLADFFRVWLNGTGIPVGFRARYQEKTSSEFHAPLVQTFTPSQTRLF